MRTGLTKAQKITEITFDEKEPLIHIRTHNTDLKNRLAAYAAQHGFPYRVNDLPYGRSEKGHPTLVNYFYHEKIRLNSR